MPNMQNSISIDFRQNDSLREALSGKKVGDTLKVEITLQVDGLTADGLTGSIKVFAPEGYEPPPEPSPDETKEGIEPDTTSPVAVLIGAGKRSRAA